MTDEKQHKRNRTPHAEHRNASEREFEKLYRESYATVYNYVRYRMDGSTEVEDVVAEAYLRAARSFSTFDPTRAKFSTWVVKIAHNCMASHWRKSHPTAPIDTLLEKHASPIDATKEVHDRDQAERLLNILSSQERDLVLMKYREGYRNVDIAAELGMNPSTVSSKLARALKKMHIAASGPSPDQSPTCQ